MNQLAIKGRVRVAVIDHQGKELFALPWQSNLLLDQGMDAIADNLIADIFRVGVKGHGTEATLETVDAANSYTAASGTVTRTAGTRDFTSADVGKWLGLSTDPNQGGKITSLTSATVVEIDDDSVAFVAADIKLYSVHQVGMDDEFGVDIPGVTYTKPLADATVTASGAAFAASDVGRAIRFPNDDVAYEITAFTDSTHVEVDISANDQEIAAASDGFLYDIRNEDLEPASRSVTYGAGTTDNSTTTATNTRTLKRSFIFDPEPEVLEDIADTNTYSRAGTTVTRTAGTRDFTSVDVGKFIYFDTAGVESEITGFTSATQVTVADSGTISAQTAKLYGYNTYEEIGFSHLDEPGDNLNIRIKLAAPVNVNGATSVYPGRQLKATYELEITVEPDTSQSGSMNIIVGGSSMNATRTGNFAIESFSTSQISTTGETNNDFTLLEPATPGFLGLSTNSDVIDPLSDKVRSESVVFAEFEAQEYTPGAFTRLYSAEFGLNEAIGTAWRSLFLGDPDTNTAVFTFRYNAAQTKTSDRVFSMTLSKTWARDLS